tara:strand:+ start:164 stop:928 length:765 start_codon:yes stop_codon:yes gene_type:complete
MKPLILIVNDDGIYSPGIQALADAMVKIGKVTIIAPDNEQSGKSHSLTLNDPIRLKHVNLKKGLKGWAVNGTPVDCAKVAIKKLFDKKPDLVFSGINLGANLGRNLIYSGTVSAAYEGSILGVSSAAISLDSFKGNNFVAAKYVATKIANHLLKHKLPKGTMLNVNVPDIAKKDLKGFLVTKQGSQSFVDTYEKRIDPRGNSYFWIRGEMINDDSSIEYDGEAVSSGYVSVTPIQFRITNELYINELKKKILYE